MLLLHLKLPVETAIVVMLDVHRPFFPFIAGYLWTIYKPKNPFLLRPYEVMQL